MPHQINGVSNGVIEMALRAAITRRVMNPSWAYGTRSIFTWRNVDSDSKFGVADPTINKLNTQLGACRGNFGKLEMAVMNMQYLSMDGNVNTTDETPKLAFGENSDLIKEKRDAAIQTVSGTGACRPFADFQKRFVHENEERAVTVKSQLQQLVGPMYRYPSVHSALIGSTVLRKSFSLANIRTTHSQAGVTSGSGGVMAKLRPLSPHLTVYKPQSTSTSSIFHRIAYICMGVAALFYYFLYLKMGMVCFTYEKFYQFFYYSSGLFPIINEILVVALAYYLFKGAEQFIKFR